MKKYIVVGVATLAIAGVAIFGATQLFSHSEKAPQAMVATKKSQSTTEKNSSTQASTTTKSSAKKATKKATKKSSSTTKAKETSASTSKTEASKEKATVNLDATALLNSAGNVSYGVYYFKDKTDLNHQNNQPMVAANVINAFIMDYAMNQTGGSQQVIENKTLSEWLAPMIQQNDIAATNVLIDHYGMDAMNAYFQDQGYSDTRIERRMLDINVLSTDKENYTSVNDCMTLLKKLYSKRKKAPQKAMLQLMEGQQIKNKIPEKIPKNMTIANLSGAQQTVENDIGIVFDKDHPFAIVVLASEVSDIVSTRTAIAEFSLTASMLK
ncbi:hypothetical protein RV04_GL000308 [Enterococcus hermanniensis]|uniref:Beta-lactamase class A catalytic domain-containing protein n=1 Tax=Enterococcus hermanniensis TaxID=249189 RepID=A0A1L8TRV5_9ENTE|nr:hypothetical protein RV04_GL000308 [Enterococcus hermanniensis]